MNKFYNIKPSSYLSRNRM